jgi:hypothetical protein
MRSHRPSSYPVNILDQAQKNRLRKFKGSQDMPIIYQNLLTMHRNPQEIDEPLVIMRTVDLSRLT